ncbi:alpha/beta hydrolase [Streptomyces sp. SP17BM10]|uniref:alpha/beta fold hydrolase n=1 Tax=Streptomyces sp. SP17BM10 TaxID=3002530 RepID=UPI002E774215|nr:alpha/beta hydrolase [Streptomyces sp. SP17BM10]MEE1783524.1 alpha/beta hydrolase [Streptomyces sp. SP17BM10]
MPRARVNGVDLSYELTGDGDPLVLVHGSWGDHFNWVPVLPALAERYRVLVYDRRGHSRSERPPGQGSRTEDEDDLAALVEGLGLAPAHVAGNFFGASTVLGLAARRPELFRSVIAHEPPLMGVVAPDAAGDLEQVMRDAQEKIDSVLAHLRAGETFEGAYQFVEEVALGPGTWERFPEEVRATFLTNAPTFLDEQDDPGWSSLALDRLSGYRGPALLTMGTVSPPWFPVIIARLAGVLPQAEVRTLVGAGHIPHVTHPAEYVRNLTGFIDAHT